MKKFRYLFLCMAFLSAITTFAQKDGRAKEILDRTSAALADDSGIKAAFNLKNYRLQKLSSETNGSIALRGNRFVLETPGTTTWFNGHTQWTYVAENEEINVSNPTDEELQSINPYAFINLYKHGFNYDFNGKLTYKGKSVDKITLTPEDRRQEISKIELLIEQGSRQPVFIRVNARNGEEMQVEILSYRNKQNLPEKSFTLDAKRYPDAEIIDLR